MVTLESWRQQNSTPTIAQDTNGLAHWNAVLTSKHRFLLQKMALESFLPRQGQFSLCCRQTLWTVSNCCPSPALGKGACEAQGDRSYCAAGEGPAAGHAARTLCTGWDYTVQERRQNTWALLQPPPTAQPLSQLSSDTARDGRTHPGPSHAPQHPELGGRASVFSCS